MSWSTSRRANGHSLAVPAASGSDPVVSRTATIASRDRAATFAACRVRSRVHVANGVFHVTQTRDRARDPLHRRRPTTTRSTELLGARRRSAPAGSSMLTATMSNHVHLLIQTPEPTLPLGMQFLASQYVQEFNLRHGRRGALVQGTGTRRASVETPGALSWILPAVLSRCQSWWRVTAGLCDGRPEDWRVEQLSTAPRADPETRRFDIDLRVGAVRWTRPFRTRRGRGPRDVAVSARVARSR